MSEDSSDWVGVDFDSTLAYLDEWQGKFHLGKPIPAMVAFVRSLLEQGKEVRVMTARVCPDPDYTEEELEEIHRLIEDWTEEHIGTRLSATCMKDRYMIALFDDKAFHVTPNTGIVHIPEDE
ncbi:HAD hydrolase [Burkholderia phage BcepSauron]|uniref:HAD hydrolase n=1 Tax=Burkholderia phage BcepSauron TaxID=2530033 RepID=A0A482MKM8_9CAUD|nr:HAD hydrolase [Burkholderia phage BcepSauron]QBQ74601.1 HAD hydrolase [Burkholderia phage BcepSauron]